jgi:hypothetical protein
VAHSEPAVGRSGPPCLLSHLTAILNGWGWVFESQANLMCRSESSAHYSTGCGESASVVSMFVVSTPRLVRAKWELSAS